MDEIVVNKLNYCDFDCFRDDILELLQEAMNISFPDIEFSSEYYCEKLDSVAEYLKEGTAIIFLALNGDEAIGWIWCHKIIRMNAVRLHIANIAVKPTYRKRGIGKKLLQYGENYAKDHEYSGVDLLVTSSNIDALKFYRTLGYIDERIQLKKEIQ